MCGSLVKIPKSFLLLKHPFWNVYIISCSIYLDRGEADLSKNKTSLSKNKTKQTAMTKQLQTKNLSLCNPKGLFFQQHWRGEVEVPGFPAPPAPGIFQCPWMPSSIEQPSAGSGGKAKEARKRRHMLLRWGNQEGIPSDLFAQAQDCHGCVHMLCPHSRFPGAPPRKLMPTSSSPCCIPVCLSPPQSLPEGLSTPTGNHCPRDCVHEPFNSHMYFWMMCVKPTKIVHEH